MGAIRAKVAARALSAGDRLPSIRSLAATMGVSPSTVVEAYDRLAADGLIRARRGSGFYVSPTITPPLALAEVGPRRDREVDPFWVSRQSAPRLVLSSAARSRSIGPGAAYSSSTSPSASWRSY